MARAWFIASVISRNETRTDKIPREKPQEDGIKPPLVVIHSFTVKVNWIGVICNCLDEPVAWAVGVTLIVWVPGAVLIVVGAGVEPPLPPQPIPEATNAMNITR
jgi:hypothetical protein